MSAGSLAGPSRSLGTEGAGGGEGTEEEEEAHLLPPLCPSSPHPNPLPLDSEKGASIPSQ